MNPLDKHSSYNLAAPSPIENFEDKYHRLSAEYGPKAFQELPPYGWVEDRLDGLLKDDPEFLKYAVKKYFWDFCYDKASGNTVGGTRESKLKRLFLKLCSRGESNPDLVVEVMKDCIDDLKRLPKMLEKEGDHFGLSKIPSIHRKVLRMMSNSLHHFPENAPEALVNLSLKIIHDDDTDDAIDFFILWDLNTLILSKLIDKSALSEQLLSVIITKFRDVTDIRKPDEQSLRTLVKATKLIDVEQTKKKAFFDQLEGLIDVMDFNVAFITELAEGIASIDPKKAYDMMLRCTLEGKISSLPADRTFFLEVLRGSKLLDQCNPDWRKNLINTFLKRTDNLKSVSYRPAYFDYSTTIARELIPIDPMQALFLFKQAIEKIFEDDYCDLLLPGYASLMDVFETLVKTIRDHYPEDSEDREVLLSEISKRVILLPENIRKNKSFLSDMKKLNISTY